MSTTLGRFTRDLTADARAGLLEPVRCRDEEVARVIDILLRHGKNNPTLVGPAGVGKTAIAEGLAQRIASGRVPLTLRTVRLLSLDHVSLLAGTTYRGQYEERIRAIVADTTAAGNVILFIDELHNLIGQGTAIGAAMDAANMLKPALVRGEFRVIGATTGNEYEKWIEGDPALERRFQKVTVHELGERETLEILQARKERLERHHNVLITDDALLASVKLTDAHVTDRMRPDKALDASMRHDLRVAIERRRDQGSAFLLSSHHIAELEDICNDIAFLLDGEILDEARLRQDHVLVERRVRATFDAPPDAARLPPGTRCERDGGAWVLVPPDGDDGRALLAAVLAMQPRSLSFGYTSLQEAYKAIYLRRDAGAKR